MDDSMYVHTQHGVMFNQTITLYLKIKAGFRVEGLCGGLTLASCQLPVQSLSHSSSTGQADKIK